MIDIAKTYMEAEIRFLETLAILLETHDWSEDLFSLIEEKCGFLPNYHLILFPLGIADIAEKFESWQDSKMLEILANQAAPSKIREKIAKALEIRIIDVVPKSVILKQNALFFEPHNIFLGAKCYFQTCNIIWNFAGDKSDDFNFYTKRTLLLGVYKASSLFYLSDDSENFTKTREFIKTALDQIIKLANIKNKFPNPENIPILRMF